VKDILLHGSGEDEIKFIYDDGMRRYETKKTFEGVIPNMERRFKETDFFLDPRGDATLSGRVALRVCNGYRLKPEALAVKMRGCTSARFARNRSGWPMPGSAISTRT